MKAKALPFGKAISAALFVLLLSVVGMKNALAQTQVATLQHGDDMSAFYGANAFVEAHAAATDGDIITLSSGTFNQTTITKAITLHGAGCVADTLGISPTIITNTCIINVPNESVYLIIEGIAFQSQVYHYGNLYRAKFIKCDFNGGITNSNSISVCMVNDVQFINCRINGSARINSCNNSVSFINCVVAILYHYQTTVVNPLDYINMYNSIICGFQSSTKNYNLYNCILGSSNNVQLSNSYAYNCIEVGSVFSNSVNTYDCMSVDSYSDVFESFDGTFSNYADFHLKEEIATSFLGNDGTEVGIYGGMSPYNTRPSYLILNRCIVAPRSTVDGKLSVDIEVINGGN